MSVDQAATPPAGLESGSGKWETNLHASVADAVRATFANAPKFEDNPAEPMEDGIVDDSAPPPADAPKEDTSKPTQDAGKPADSKDVARPVEEPKAAPEVKTSLDAPIKWPEDRRKEFNALPDAAKKILLDREREYNQGISRLGQDNADHRRRSEAVVSSFQNHHRQQMQQSGLDEVGAVRYLLQQHDAFNSDPVGFVSNVAKQTNPVQFVQALMQRTGLTLDQLAGGQMPSQQQQPPISENEWVDPHVTALKQELGMTKQQLDRILQTQAQREQQEAQRRQAEANRQAQALETQLHNFYTAMDETGNPRFPHAKTVENAMAMIIQNDPSLQSMNIGQALETAYNQALFLNPDLRQQILDEKLAAERAQWQAERDAENAAREAERSVAKAKAAATVKGSPGANGASVGTKRMSIREAATAGVREAYRNR